MPPKRATTKAAPKEKEKGKKAKLVQLTPEALSAAINKQMGAGTMMMASDPSLRISRIPTGILAIDYLTGGGFPRNRYVEIYGSAHVGKTYLALCYVASAQRLGLRCAWVECENTFDPRFAKICGVKIKKLAFHSQEHGNKVVDFMETLLYSGLYDVIILDSIAALLPESEQASNMSAGTYGTEQAKLMSKALRKLTAANKKTSIVLLNQQREAIGVLWGKKTIEPGGRAVKHYTGMRIELNRTENITRSGKKIDTKTNKAVDSDKIVIGHRLVAKMEKDKTGGSRPSEETTMVFSYVKHRHDHLEDLIYLGRVLGLIGVNGSSRWWVYGYEKQMVTHRKAFKKWLRKVPEVQEELEAQIVAAILVKNRKEEDDD